MKVDYGPGGIERRESVLTEVDKEWLTKAMIENRSCKSFTPEEVAAMKEMCGIVRNMGDDNINRGVDRFREHNKFIQALLNKKAVLAGAAMLAMASMTAAAIWLAMWEGIKIRLGIM